MSNDALPQTITGGFLTALAERADAAAVRWRDDAGQWHSWTTAELGEQVAMAAAGLRALGVEPGQRVILMLRNIAEFHVADLAVLFCGATPVSIYNSSAPEQIAYLAGHAEACVAIVEDAAFLDRFDQVRDQLPLLTHVVVVRPGGSDSAAGAVAWSALLDHDPVELEDLATPATPATVIYTSGTTGPPKGVLLTHANVVAQVAALRAMFDIDITGRRVVSYLPMAHIAERAVSHYGMVLNGYVISCCPDLDSLGEYLVQVRPQVIFGVPRVWEKIRSRILAAVAADPERAATLSGAIAAATPIAMARNWGTATPQQDANWEFLQSAGLRAVREMVGLDQAEYAITGAAPIPVEVIEWWNGLGVPLSEVYGMSENAGAMTWTPWKIKPGTVGPPLPGAEVRLGEDGEVLCRGPIVFAGYLKDSERTSEALDADGWLHTGDIGEFDEDGYLKIVDRKKELIITAGGKNISPANLEAALKTIPLVAQAFVVGDGRPYTAALVLLDPEAAPAWATARGITYSSLAELAEHPDVLAEVHSGLDAAMKPFSQAEKVKKLRVLGTEWLPDSDELTPTAKLKRRVIRTKYSGEIDALYA